MKRLKPAANPYKSVAQRSLRLETLEARRLLSVNWRNPVDHLDVNEDSRISALDALIVINELNRSGSRQLPSEKDPNLSFINTNGDSRLSAIDALIVINHLNGPNRHRELKGQQNFDNQQEIQITLGQPTAESTRLYRMQIETTGLTTSPDRLLDDLFSVYLVNPTDTTKTLLDRGTNGTSLFSLSARGAELAQGLVRWDGSVLEIDVGSIPDIDTGILRAQLLSRSPNSQAFVNLKPLSNTIEEETQPGQLLRLNSLPLPSGGSMNIAQLSPSNSIEASIGNIRYDRASGVFAAEVEIENLDSAIGRNVALVLPVLPSGVQLTNASGTDSQGRPYLNLREAIRAGGLGRNERSELVELLISNPNRIPLDLKPEILVGPANSPPVLPVIATQTVMPGSQLEIEIGATDADGDQLNYSVRSANDSSPALPSTRLDTGTGRLVFEPTPSQLGQYQVEVTANDGALRASRTFTLNVVADPITTTRISGRVLDVDETPIAGMQVEIGGIQGLTQSDGRFTLDFGSGPVVADTLKIRGELYTDPVRPQVKYPFIAEKIRFMFGREVYQGYNNVLQRPIFLPKLNSGTSVTPTTTTIVSRQLRPDEAAVQVTIEANTLFDQQGVPFSGELSITEVPIDRTPLVLPENLRTNLVVTIQPGEMTFATPARLTMPNRFFPIGIHLDLWSINPVTGQFEDVGDGRISEDGKRIETIAGGIRNSSWHFFTILVGKDPRDETNQKQCLPECSHDAASVVGVNTGSHVVSTDLMGSNSLGSTHSTRLSYDSGRARSSSSVGFSFAVGTETLPGNPPPIGLSFAYITYATVSLFSIEDNIETVFDDNGSAFSWKTDGIAVGQRMGGQIPLDLSNLKTGTYRYRMLAGMAISSGTSSSSSMEIFEGTISNINTKDSAFGAGWGVAGLQQILEHTSDPVSRLKNEALLIDGDGTELRFKAGTTPGTYQSPIGDFSTLIKASDGRFERLFKDGTKTQFDSKNRIESVTDRVGNRMRYMYGSQGQLEKTIDPVGLETSYQFENGLVKKIVYPDGRFVSMEYDGHDNMISTTAPDGSVKRFEYDSRRLMTAEIDERGYRTESRYNAAGKLIEVIRPDGSSQKFDVVENQGIWNSAFSNVSVNFDSIASFTSPGGRTTTREATIEGHILSIRDGAGFLSSVTRNEQNLPETTTDGRNHEQRFGYDSRGNVVSMAQTVTKASSIFDIPSFSSSNGTSLINRELVTRHPQYYEFASGDFNNDSNIDVVILGRSNDLRMVVTVFPGDGYGGFGAPIDSFGEEGASRFVESGDLDNDGNSDLAIALHPQNQIVFFRGLGDGTFATNGNLQLPDLARSAKIIDIDKNGTNELLIQYANDRTKRLEIRRAPQPFQFTDVIAIDSPIEVGELSVIDINNDQTLDLVLLDEASSAFASYVQRNGSFQFVSTVQIPENPRSLATGDFDSDGDIDVAVSYHSPMTVRVYSGLGDGTFLFADSIELPHRGNQLTTIDLGNDFRDDLVVELNEQGGPEGVAVLKQGKTGLEFSTIVPTTNSPDSNIRNDIAVDLNGDGLKDLLRLQNQWRLGGGVHTMIQSLNGNFLQPIEIEAPFESNRIEVGDFNGDGIGDVVATLASGPGISTFLGKGNGRFEPAVINTNLLEAKLIADFDRDGLDDALSFTHRRLEIGFGEPGGKFSRVKSFATALAPKNKDAQVLGDYNNDNIPDFAIAGTFYGDSNQPTGWGMEVYLSDNSGNYSQTKLLTDSVTQEIIQGDMDADGDMDLTLIGLPQFNGPIKVTIYLNDGFGQFSLARNFDLEGTGLPYELTSGDFNRDGLTDLVVDRDNSASLFVFPNLGNLTFGNPVSLIDRAQKIVSQILSVDVNQDGNLDLVTINGNATDPRSSYSVFLGTGTGDFGSPMVFDAGRSLKTANFSDLNLDGRLDLITTGTSGVFIYGIYDELTSHTLRRSYSYGAFSQLSSMTDEIGRETRLQIDSTNGNITGIHRPLGNNESMTYTSQGLLDQHTDVLGRLTDTDYDTLGRATKIISAKGTPDESTIMFGYDLTGNNTSITDPNGNVTTYAFDAMRRMTSSKDALGNETKFRYDEAGNLVEMTDVLGRKTVHLYDNRNRRIRTTDAIGNVTRFGYDFDSNLTSVTDANGNTTRYRYDARNRRIETIDPNGGRALFKYDGNNNVTRIIDPNGNSTQFVYDERNLLIRELDPLGKITLYDYDNVGNLVAMKDRNGRITRYQYDLLDRLTKEIWENGGNTINYTYDLKGNVLTIKDSFSSLTYTYDSLDRVKTVDNLGTPGATRVLLTYDYDLAGNILSVADSISGSTTGVTSMAYDALNRMKQIKQNGTIVSEKRVDYEFNPLSQLTSIKRFSDLAGTQTAVNTSFSFDGLNRLSLIDHKNSAGTSLSSFGYGYDSASRIIQIVEKNQSIDYGYDNRDQLVSANYGDAARTDEAFKFDANGNRVESNAHGTAYRTGPGNRLLTDGVYIYEYDNEGNLTKRTEIATGSTREFQWDHRNRLTTLTDKNAGGVLQQVVRYSYDSFGRRISKQVDTTPLDTVDAAIEQYVYDGDDVILDFVDPDGSGPVASQQTTRYLRGPGIDNLIAIESASGTNWVLQDHLGSTRALVSSAGVLVQSIDYDSFGKAIVAGSPSTRYLYTGRELDAESGLFYYRARYYDSSTGRFTNEDPIGFAGGSWNTQIYVDNSPISAIDPMGLSFWGTVGDAWQSYSDFVGGGAIRLGEAILRDPLAFVPVYGPGRDAYRDYECGDYLGAMANGLLGAIEAIPFAAVAAKYAKLGKGGAALDKGSRAPKNLMDQMVLDAAKQGKGKKIIENLNDPKFKGMEKWSYGEKAASGKRSEVHYVRNPKTGELTDFKFKHHAQ